MTVTRSISAQRAWLDGRVLDVLRELGPLSSAALEMHISPDIARETPDLLFDRRGNKQPTWYVIDKTLKRLRMRSAITSENRTWKRT